MGLESGYIENDYTRRHFDFETSHAYELDSGFALGVVVYNKYIMNNKQP